MKIRAQITKLKKALLRGKVTVLSASIKNMEKSHTSKLTANLEALEEKEAKSTRRSI